jgi:hypothetical protein
MSTLRSFTRGDWRLALLEDVLEALATTRQQERSRASSSDAADNGNEMKTENVRPIAPKFHCTGMAHEANAQPNPRSVYCPLSGLISLISDEQFTIMQSCVPWVKRCADQPAGLIAERTEGWDRLLGETLVKSTCLAHCFNANSSDNPS